ncbi:hypothetical protein UlMin_035240 [Ulmus minor]
MDGFDRLPDSLILLIFNSVSDVKTLIRCRAVSKRFNSLAPQTDSLSLKVDCVISSESDEDDSFLLTFFKSIIRSFQDLVSHPIPAARTLSQNSPAEILRGFERVRELEIELPSGDLKLEKGAVLKWRAEFGSTLRSCVILGFRAIRSSSENSTEIPGDEGEGDFAGGLKVRVVWTISALIAASARHFLLKEVVEEQREMERLVLRDREGEGTVVMDKAALAEFRESSVEEKEEEEEGRERNRTRVPSVKMRMRHEPRLELNGGVWAEGATLVVVRPSLSGTHLGGGADVVAEMREDVELATGAFGEGLYGEAVQALLKSRSYLLEMNSF